MTFVENSVSIVPPPDKPHDHPGASEGSVDSSGDGNNDLRPTETEVIKNEDLASNLET